MLTALAPSQAVLSAAVGELQYEAAWPKFKVNTPWGWPLSGWRLNGPPAGHATLYWDGRSVAAPLQANPSGERVRAIGDAEEVLVFARGDVFEIRASYQASTAAAATDGAVLSPMPGRIVAAPVQAGQAVVRGQPLVVLEAMKMEHALTAPFDGVVAELNAVVGEQVSEGVTLARVAASD
jgi:acetyl/propionyl-CoA carboxylase alpha subunit